MPRVIHLYYFAQIGGFDVLVLGGDVAASSHSRGCSVHAEGADSAGLTGGFACEA